MRQVITISDYKVVKSDEDILVTHSLGSCIGLALYDGKAKVGGMLHYMLPFSGANRSREGFNPVMYGDTGIPLLFEEMYKLGAIKERIRIVIVGGAKMKMGQGSDVFSIGQRNVVVAKKLFWKNNVIIDAEDAGGDLSRTFYLDMKTGETWFTTKGVKHKL